MQSSWVTSCSPQLTCFLAFLAKCRRFSHSIAYEWLLLSRDLSTWHAAAFAGLCQGEGLYHIYHSMWQQGLQSWLIFFRPAACHPFVMSFSALQTHLSHCKKQCLLSFAAWFELHDELIRWEASLRAIWLCENTSHVFNELSHWIHVVSTTRATRIKHPAWVYSNLKHWMPCRHTI